MNPRVSPPSRFACRALRPFSALLAEPLRPGSLIARHVERCPDCREYFARLQSLDQQLVHAARASGPELPAGLEERLFASVRTARQAPAERRPAARTWVAVGGFAAAAAAAIALVALRTPSDSIVPGERSAAALPGAPDTGEPAREPARAAESAWWDALSPRVAALDADNPLQRELEAVQADTRSALQFLARNFLPSDVSGEAAAPPETRSS